ncbi:alkaline phosphatase family protein [Arundinibacter roseus]|uniref:Alkaline phosphatase family protein n=1 Tax=Arundinibacter roseus TaxID=2070510 RepID=A0A4R4KIP9_9BACT|nr:alkaline phosphatase family protein [Arundinibacter roseus]TDB68107.1 alkaline phosphatase family protein [Arundinibacter roseus]
MNYSFALFCLLLTSGLTSYTSQAQSAAEPKAIFIIVDGISADVLENIATPNLDAIAKIGGYSRAYVGGEKGAYSQTPTISAVGYNSLLTGTWVNKHNVWGNDIKAPNYLYHSIFRFFENQYPHKKTAVFSTWLDNRTKLIGEGLPQTGQLRLDYSFDGFELDTLHFPHDKQAHYIRDIDELVAAEAARYLRQESPDLSWVYLEFTDDMGHRHGDSEFFYEAVRQMDRQVGQIWAAIQERQQTYGENWQLFITTDHGRSADTGKNHGGQSDRERSTWLVTNATNLNRLFTQSAASGILPGIVDIMPTLTRHLQLHIPKEQAFELDGVPLTGPISLIKPTTKLEGKTLNIGWKSMSTDPNEGVKIWLTTTNNFEKGGSDRYLFMGEAKLSDEGAQLSVEGLPTEFFKLVLQGRHNSVNRWIVNQK